MINNIDLLNIKFWTHVNLISQFCESYFLHAFGAASESPEKAFQ